MTVKLFVRQSKLVKDQSRQWRIYTDSERLSLSLLTSFKLQLAKWHHCHGLGSKGNKGSKLHFFAFQSENNWKIRASKDAFICRNKWCRAPVLLNSARWAPQKGENQIEYWVAKRKEINCILWIRRSLFFKDDISFSAKGLWISANRVQAISLIEKMLDYDDFNMFIWRLRVKSLLSLMQQTYAYMISVGLNLSKRDEKACKSFHKNMQESKIVQWRLI